MLKERTNLSGNQKVNLCGPQSFLFDSQQLMMCNLKHKCSVQYQLPQIANHNQAFDKHKTTAQYPFLLLPQCAASTQTDSIYLRCHAHIGAAVIFAAYLVACTVDISDTLLVLLIMFSAASFVWCGTLWCSIISIFMFIMIVILIFLKGLTLLALQVPACPNYTYVPIYIKYVWCEQYVCPCGLVSQSLNGKQ